MLCGMAPRVSCTRTFYTHQVGVASEKAIQCNASCSTVSDERCDEVSDSVWSCGMTRSLILYMDLVFDFGGLYVETLCLQGVQRYS